MPNTQPPKEQNFRSVLERIARSKGSLVSTFSDFACMTACAYAMQTREEEYLQVAGSYSREELNEFAKAMGLMVTEMERRPFKDILGVYYCEVQSKFTRDAGGEFYTPQAIGQLMAKISVNAKAAIAEGKPVMVNDPAAGSGGLMLSIAEEFAEANAVDLLRVTCQDISKVGCDMAYINMTLWGIPARIIWGDTLRMEIRQQWENIHWHRVGEPMREQLNAFMSILESETKSEPPNRKQKIRNKSVEREMNFQTNAVGQQEWVFE